MLSSLIQDFHFFTICNKFVVSIERFFLRKVIPVKDPFYNNSNINFVRMIWKISPSTRNINMAVKMQIT